MHMDNKMLAMSHAVPTSHTLSKALQWATLTFQWRGDNMASQQGTVDFLLDQMAGAGGISARKMFGEYGVYCDGKMFAIVADDQLFIKPTEAGRAWISAQGTLQQAPPYPQAKPYFLIAGELWDERDWLSQLARRTADALPAPKPKPPTKARK